MIPKVDEDDLDTFIPVFYSNGHLSFSTSNILVTGCGPQTPEDKPGSGQCTAAHYVHSLPELYLLVTEHPAKSNTYQINTEGYWITYFQSSMNIIPTAQRRKHWEEYRFCAW